MAARHRCRSCGLMAAWTLNASCVHADTTLQASVIEAKVGKATSTLAVQMSDCNIGQLCAMNLSFEGSPTYGRAWLSDAPLDAAPWDDCRVSDAGARTLSKIVDGTREAE